MGRVHRGAPGLRGLRRRRPEAPDVPGAGRSAGPRAAVPGPPGAVGHRPGQEPGHRSGRVPAGRLLRRRGGQGLRRIRAAAADGECHRLWRPADGCPEADDARQPGGPPAGRALRPRAGGRVPGHQQRAVPAGALPVEAHRQHHGGRRRGPIDLQVARGGHPQHPGLRARPPRGGGGEAGAELPVERLHPAGGQRHHLPQHRTAAEEAVHRCGRGRAHHRVRGGDRTGRGGVRGRHNRQRAERRHGPARVRGVLPDQRPVPGAGRGAARARHPLCGGGRHPVLRPGRDQGSDRVFAGHPQSGGRHRPAAHRELASPGHRRQHPGPSGGVRPPPADGGVGRPVRGGKRRPER